MKESSKFPLICGHLSIDLVNTEVVRRGQRHDLLPFDADIWEWLNTVQSHIHFWNDKQLEIKHKLPEIKAKLIELRRVLRQQFENICDHRSISEEFIHYLEERIQQAPITYVLRDNQLKTIPIGELSDMFLSIIALDVLNLIEQEKLLLLKRCANDECVLLFLDDTGRRKWCSMKICGNRKKVAEFQHRKLSN